MQISCVVVLCVFVASAGRSDCAVNGDALGSCPNSVPVADATSLLQQRHVKMFEGESAEITYVSMSTKWDLKCMEHSAVNDNVFMRGCSGEKNQLWYFENGFLKTAQDANKCLDYKDDDGGRCGDRDKCNVFMNTCKHTSSQKWYWDGRWNREEVLKTKNSNDLVLDYDHSNNVVKGNVRMYRNTWGSGQTWIRKRQADPTACPVGQQVLKPNNDDQCLTADIDSDKDVDVKPCQGKTPQLWVTLTGEGQLKLGDGNCLEKDANSDRAYKHKCDGGENKVWRYENGLLKAKYGRPNFGECLEHNRGEKGVRVRRCNGRANQKWDFAESPQCAVAVDCTLSDWKPWGACTKTCGGGLRTRSRTVTAEAQHGGTCTDDREETEKCGQKACPVDCTLSDWKPWGACSATCGTGTKARSRSVKIDEQHGGKPCAGDLSESGKCKEKECPVHCKVSDWTSWNACSEKCGDGKRSRFRKVIVKPEHGGKCDDALEDSEKCKEKECPVDCKVSKWGDWSQCNAPNCGTGKVTRSRSVTVNAQHGGKACEKLSDSKECSSSCIESVLCGKVKDATNFKPIEKVTVKLKGTGREEHTDAEGSFCFGLRPGDAVTFIASKKVYITQETGPMTITDKTPDLGDITMSQVIGSKDWRFVLTWKEKPADLDTVVQFGPKTCTHHTVTYADAKQGVRKCDKNGVGAETELDNMDIKTTKEPETVKIVNADPGKCCPAGTDDCTDYCMIYYRVHNYSSQQGRGENGFLKDSNARVEVYNGGRQVKTFHINQDGKLKEPFWDVFALDIKKQAFV